MKTERLVAFVRGTRILSVAAIALGAHALRSSPVEGVTLAPLVLTVGGALALLRVPRRRLLLELALVDAWLAVVAWQWGYPHSQIVGAPAIVCAIAAVALVLAAPESGLLRLNAIDRYFVVHDYDRFHPNSHQFVDTREPLDRAALERAVADVHRDFPTARSFVREGFFGAERFVAREPWASASDLVSWTDDPSEESEALALDAPIDLSRAPPFRVRFAPREGGGQRLVLTIHHSAADGTGGWLLFELLLQRYDDLRAGREPKPFPAETPTPRYRELFLKRGIGWTLAMIRRHVHPLAKVGVKNASVVDDEDALPAHTRHVLVTLSSERWEKLKLAATALGRTRNDLLVTCALRAADAWRRKRGRADLSWRLLFPLDLRPVLGLERCFHNYVGMVLSVFSPEEARSADLPRLVSERVQLGKTPEEAVETPVNLGVVGGLLPPWLFRRELAKWDKDPRSFFYSFVFSNVRLPELTLPAGTERVWGRGSLPRQPGLGLLIAAYGQQVTIAFHYLEPLASSSGVRDLAELFEAEIDRSILKASP